MKWKLPGEIKIYEALGTVGDGRVELKTGHQMSSLGESRVYSSSGNKFYDVSYDESKGKIMCNDNASYWQGTLGYPAIAYLMQIGKLSYNPKLARALAGIAWKDLNTKHKNDFNKTALHVDSLLVGNGIDLDDFKHEVNNILSQIKSLNLSHLGPKAKPPVGY